MYIRDEVLLSKPLHENQHAYRAGRSVETVLHQMVTSVERVVWTCGMTMRVFIDRQGAFDNA